MHLKFVLSLFIGGCFAALLLWALKPNRPDSMVAESPASTELADMAAPAPSRITTGTGNSRFRPAKPGPSLRLTEDLQELTDASTSNSRLARISPFALQMYLDDNHLSAASLLAAYQATQDPAYLTEAATQHPTDSRVQYTMALYPDQTSAEKRAWLDRLRISAPNNALASYLSAREYFSRGEPALALQDLARAAGQPEFHPYVWDAMIEIHELLLADGASPAVARIGSMFNAALPHLSQMRQLGTELSELQVQYGLTGDLASFDKLTRLGLELAQRLKSDHGGGFLIDQLVGMAIEQTVLENVDGSSAPDYLGMTVQERLDQLATQKAEIRTLGPLAEEILPSLSDAELVAYLDRVRVNGELEALRQLKNRQP